MMEKYTEIIRGVGATLIEKYKRTGRVETGINGPYDDPETEVRYLAHLIVICAIECIKYSKEEYCQLVAEMADRLLSMRQANGLYKMRTKPGKDDCNGTIGHAWLIEGFLYAYKATGNEKYLEESESIFDKHIFNPSIGLWGRPLKGCDDRAIDYTFNHELWYAATLAEYLQVRKNDKYQQQLDVFLKNLSQILSIDRNGRVAHSIYQRISLKESIKHHLARIRDVMSDLFSRPGLRYKEVGYHMFNVMAFARLYNVSPDVPFFQSKRFKKIVEYVSRDSYVKELLASNIDMDNCAHGSSLTKEEKSINIYGYPYNVPGLEVMFCQAVFKDYLNKDIAQLLLETQFKLTWNKNSKLFDYLCHDKVSVNYRVYEYYRYLEIV